MIQGITCNICKAPMTERIERQLSVALDPVTLPNGHIRKVIAQFIAGGAEYQEVKTSNFDTQGKRLEDAVFEQEVIKAKDYDICLKCTVKAVEEALEIVKAGLIKEA